MEASMIEQLDKLRYNLIKGITIGGASWFGAYIAKDWLNNRLMLGVLFLIGSIGWVYYTVSIIKFIKFNKKVNANSHLKEALGNEMHQFFKYKSFYVGYWVMIVAITIFFAVSLSYKVPTKLVCEVTLFFGAFSPLVMALIFNKD